MDQDNKFPVLEVVDVFLSMMRHLDSLGVVVTLSFLRTGTLSLSSLSLLSAQDYGVWNIIDVCTPLNW